MLNTANNAKLEKIINGEEACLKPSHFEIFNIMITYPILSMFLETVEWKGLYSHEGGDLEKKRKWYSPRLLLQPGEKSSWSCLVSPC